MFHGCRRSAKPRAKERLRDVLCSLGINPRVRVVARGTAAGCDRRGPAGATRRCTSESTGRAGVSEVGELVLPDALLLEAAKEAFDNSVLLGAGWGVVNSWRRW